MNGRKSRMSVLLLGVVLVLLLATACAAENEINAADGRVLTGQGDAYMACLKEKDFQCAYNLLSPFSRNLIDDTKGMVESYVDLESMVKAYGPDISTWSFDEARFFTRDGVRIGSLEGEVRYMNGTHGKLNLEFEKESETWKVRSTEISTGIIIGISPFNQ